MPSAPATRASTRTRAKPAPDPDGLVAALLSAPVQQTVDAAQRAVDAVPDLLGGAGDGSGIGSNSWVVGGRLTTTGKPMLANDPHLAPGIPGIWYQMGLHCQTLNQATCPFDVAGFTFSGVPGVMIGHTQRIAWGMTNLAPDVTDFYLEKVDGDRYLRDGRYVPLQSRQETIKVAGSAPVTITVRSTVDGPLLSDVSSDLQNVGLRAPVSKGSPLRDQGYAVALRWTALQPGHDMDAVFAVDSATDFPSFRSAVQKLDVPAQNFVYADIDGHIGYQAPGRIPVRNGDLPSEPVPADGTWPMPGWDSRYDWKGYLPTSQLPYTEDPQEGFIVAANQAVTEPGDGPTLTHDYDYGYRAQRIRDLLRADVSAHRQIQVEDMQAIQLDSRNGIAADLVPILLKEKIGDAFTQQAIDLLKTWDYTQPVDSAAAAYFNAVWAELLDLAFADELPPGTRPDGGARWAEVVRQLLKDPQDPWWDDRRTPNVVETPRRDPEAGPRPGPAEPDERAGQGPGHVALGAAAPAAARRAAARRRGADPDAAPAAQPRPDDDAGRPGHRRRQRLRRLVGHLRRHLGAVHAHGGRPLRLRPVDVGQPDR